MFVNANVGHALPASDRLSTPAVPGRESALPISGQGHSPPSLVPDHTLPALARNRFTGVKSHPSLFDPSTLPAVASYAEWLTSYPQRPVIPYLSPIADINVWATCLFAQTLNDAYASTSTPNIPALHSL